MQKSAEAYHLIFEDMKTFVRLGPDDEGLLHRLCAHAKPHFHPIVRDFYERVREHDEAHRVFTGEDQIERLHHSLVAWLERVLTGPWDDAYCEKSLRIGRVHVRVGLPQRFMFTTMALFRMRLEEVAQTTMGEDAQSACHALTKVLDVELALMNETYREDVLAREASREDAYRHAISSREIRAGQLQITVAERVLQRYVHAVELAHAIIIGLDDDGRIRLFNRRAEEVTGYRFAEVEGAGLRG